MPFHISFYSLSHTNNLQFTYWFHLVILNYDYLNFKLTVWSHLCKNFMLKQWIAVGKVLGGAMAFRGGLRTPWGRGRGSSRGLPPGNFYNFALKQHVLSHLEMILNIVLQRRIAISYLSIKRSNVLFQRWVAVYPLLSTYLLNYTRVTTMIFLNYCLSSVASSVCSPLRQKKINRYITLI